jgi:hypothetical protein
MPKDPRPGDEVWSNSSGGRSVGRVEERLTAPTAIKGHKVSASPENPEFLVRSARSGKVAAHKAEALTKDR